jgi:hypothetical protein
MKKFIGVLFVVLSFLAAARGATVTWTNTAGGGWQTAANWSPNQVPGPADTALITTPGSFNITLSANVTVNNFTLGAASGNQTITLTSHDLKATTQGTIAANGEIVMQGGGFEGNITIASGGILTFSGAAQKTLYRTTLINDGTVKWIGGGLSIGATPATLITNTGLWEISSDVSMTWGVGGPTAVFQNSGTLRKTAGAGNAVFSNLKFVNAGTVDVQSGTVQLSSASGAILGGSFTTAAGAAVQLASGTYTENGGVFSGAGNSRMTGGTLTLVNDKLNGLSLNGGDVQIVGATFQAAGAIADLTINGANLIGTNEVAGTLTFTAGGLEGMTTVRPGGLILYSGSAQKTLYRATLINNGTVRWNGGGLSVGATPATVITNGGLWEINSDESIVWGVGGSTVVFTSNGTIRKLAGSGTTAFSNLQFVNNGAIDVQSGTIQFASAVGSILGGTVTTSAGALFVLASGTYTENGGVFSGAGNSRMTGGTLTLVTDKLNGLSLNGGDVKIAGPTFQAAGAITNLTINGANLIGTNEVAGTLTFTAGGMEGQTTVRATGTVVLSGATQKTFYRTTLINNGTVRWLGGNLAFGATPTTVMTNTGLWEISGDNSVVWGVGGPTPLFVNETTGLMQKIAGSGTTSFSNLQFVNKGTIEVQTGTIQFNSSVGSVLGGTFTAFPGAEFVLASGTYTESGATFGGGGSLRMTGGTLTLVNNIMTGLLLTGGDVALAATFQGGSISNLVLNGSMLTGTNVVSGTLTIISGGLEGQLAVASTGTLSFSGAAQKTLYRATLMNSGRVRWLGGNLAVGATPTTSIVNSNLWEISSDDSLVWGVGGPTPSFVNDTNGIVRKLSGSGVTAFNNVKFDNRGNIDVQSGTIQFNSAVGSILGGTVTTAAGAVLQLSSGTYTENGAVFSGEGISRMTGGTLMLVKDKLVGLQLNGGDVDIGPDFQAAGAITDLTISGSTLIGTNEVAGTLAFTAGGMEGVMTVRSGGTIIFSSTSQKTLYRNTLVNNGTVRWLGGNLAVGATPATQITNANLWEITSDDSLLWGVGGPTPTFTNTGTIRKLSGSGVTSLSNIQFVNSGVVEVQNGTIQFNSAVGSSLGGTFSAVTGAGVNLASGAYTENGAIFSGAGNLRFSGGTLSLVADKMPGLNLVGGDVKVGAAFQSAGAITDLALNGSTLIGTNEVAGTLTIVSGGVEGTLTIRPGATLALNGNAQKTFYRTTLNNNGTIKWLGGNLAFGATPTTIVNNSGLWEINSDDSIVWGVGGATPEFNNHAAGHLKKIGGAGVTSVNNLTFINLGTVEVLAGTFRFPNNYAHTVGKLRLSGGRIDASGLLTFAGGTLEGSGVFGSSIFTGGTISPGLNGAGKISFPSGLKLTTGSTVVIDAQTSTPETGHDQLAVTGTVDLGGAALQVGPMGPFIIGATMNIIDNDGADVVIGTFASKPEGFLFQVATQLFRIRYARGSGNDIVLIRDDGGVRLTAIKYLPDGTFQLSGLGTNSGLYKISATSDHQTWTDLGETTANAGGLFFFTDTNAHQFPFRFYQSFGPGVDIPID